MAGELKPRRTLLDAGQMTRVIRRMAVQILEHAGGTEKLMLVGIRTRGVPLAEKLAQNVEGVANVKNKISVK